LTHCRTLSLPGQRQKCRNRHQTRRKPQPGWTPGEEFRPSLASILDAFCQRIADSGH